MNTSSYPGNSVSISTHETESHQRTLKNQTLVLVIGALGVVYGDIGTSPLYAIRECFHGHHAIALTQGNIFGVMSLVFWSLTVVVGVKYVIFILLADNHGEGGTFALLGLISAGGIFRVTRKPRCRTWRSDSALALGPRVNNRFRPWLLSNYYV